MLCVKGDVMWQCSFIGDATFDATCAPAYRLVPLTPEK